MYFIYNIFPFFTPRGKLSNKKPTRRKTVTMQRRKGKNFCFSFDFPLLQNITLCIPRMLHPIKKYILNFLKYFPSYFLSTSNGK